MSGTLTTLCVARHGETAWSLSGQHTGLTDLPLTQRGQRNARRLGNALQGRVFAKVFASPLKRARDTCELAGFGALAEIDRDLVEWNYGEYESLGTEEIWANRPGWDLFQDRCPEGEAAEDAGVRADRVVERVRAVQQDVFIFPAATFYASSPRVGSDWNPKPRWRP
jgi:broad specificity phosphatase PhoE